MEQNTAKMEKARSWCELSKSALQHNIKQISKSIPKGVAIFTVIKANAYGHGAEWVAKIALACGSEYLAVACVNEAIALRDAGIESPILVLSPYHPGFAEFLIEYNITQTICSAFDAESLAKDIDSSQTIKKNPSVKIHLKLDTGMNRIGFSVKKSDQAETISQILKIIKKPIFDVEGIFTHFAVADDPSNEFTKIQYLRFQSIINQLSKEGLSFKYKHCANSAASFFFPDMAMDAVRIGISMYGWCPNPEIKRQLKLKPVMSFYSRISSIHETGARDPVGYGLTYTTDKVTRVGTIESGYADGFDRHLSNSGILMLKGRDVPIIGRICMDRTMLDLTNFSDVEVGEKVLVFGLDEDNNYRDLDELAAQAGTISYDILCRISNRIPKIYID
ncbi:MAG TPA: alanine racemase [Candidatus Eisenbacteria bacterium]|nr:alanine racemase [Candidatus Eisenbacteria bacterium]